MNEPQDFMRLLIEHLSGGGEDAKVLKREKIDDEEMALYDEFKRTEAAVRTMFKKMETAKKKFWSKVKVRLDDFEHCMRYDSEKQVIEIIDELED